MNLNTFISTVSEAVAEAGNIKSWCQVMYERSHKVFENIDLRNLPGSGDCPYVFVAPDFKSVGKTKAIREHGIMVGCAIYDDTFEADDDIENLSRYKGSQRIEEFRKLIETAIVGIDIGNGDWVTVDSDFDTLSRFPYCRVEMAMAMNETVLLGSDPLL